MTPILSARISPNKTKNIKNLDRKISYSNIYSLDRLGETDMVEGGFSLTLGSEYSIDNSNNDEVFKMSFANVLRNTKDNDLPEKSTLGNKSKVSHLSYVGDAQIGKSVNIGAGTITCNYDGTNKNKTKIKDKVFIGSNSSLVAPITINKDSIIGAGSVITKNVKKKSLALTRSPQLEVKNYKRKNK